MSYEPTLLAIGIAPPGGELPSDWLPILVEAISNGLHIVSGMHHFLSDNVVLSNLAAKHGVFLWDVRFHCISRALTSENLPNTSFLF